MPETVHIEFAKHHRALLAWARDVATGHFSSTTPTPIAPIQGEWGGVFVTLRREGKLRGCRGMIAPLHEATEAVRQATVLALTDPRFTSNPVASVEMPRVVIEISLLSDPIPTEDPLSLQPGVHGVIVRRGERSGCFLPKVGAEQGWDAETLLANCCRTKAGLDPGAWRDRETEVLLFTTDAFLEDDAPLRDER